MIKIKKTISLYLLLPFLFLNFSSGIVNSCLLDGKMKTMECCGILKTMERCGVTKSIVKTEDAHHTPRTCACQISENSEASMPFVIVKEVSKTATKKIDTQAESISLYLTLNLNSSNNSKHFEIDRLKRDPANLKIYDLVSSYLI